MIQFPEDPEASCSSREGPELQLSTETIDGIQVFALAARRADTVADLAFLRPIIEQHGDFSAPMILDVAMGGTLGSAAIGAVISLTRQCADAGGAFVLTGISPRVIELLKHLKMDRQVAFRLTTAEALSCLRCRPALNHSTLVAGNPTAEEARFRDRRRALGAGDPELSAG